MQDLLPLIDVTSFTPLLVAFALGVILGFEREMRGKEAGLRTYTLVCVGSALFAIVAKDSFLSLPPEGARLDLGNVIGAIAAGLGFLGAGLIIKHEAHIRGLTTAAGIWTTGAIGLGVGLGLYSISILATLLILFTFAVLGKLEAEVLHKEK